MTEGANPLVVAFDDPLTPGADARALLGGKGAQVREMHRALGLPVPPAFTITTEVCRCYLSGQEADRWPPGLDEQIDAHLERLGAQLGRRFGDPGAPLLVSVRSGAPVSMPGMMDTLLNVGMTPEVREALAEESGDPRFAADTWLRFCRGYAEIVLGVAKVDLDRVVGAPEGDPGALLAAAERVCGLAAERGGVPAEPAAQLRGAIEAVFRSWHSDRARVFRQREGVSDDLGTAATVQAMVFGNLDERSGTGVVFTRNPANGDPEPYGDYLVRAQGEDVVAGDHAVRGLESLREQQPAVYAELAEALRRLEHHYRDMCDVEFTVSGGRLYLLQTRVATRSPLAAARVAVAMASDATFPLTRREAVERVGPETLRRLAELGRVEDDATPLAHGLAASPGVAAGPLCCDPDRAADLAARGVAPVLAREETSPADVHGMAGAAAIVTTLGGVASHAAVVARGWAIPAVTSLQGAQVHTDALEVAGVRIAEGETVTVDGSTGAVYLGDRRAAGVEDVPELRTVREWAAEAASDVELHPTATTAVTGAEVTLMEVARAISLKGLCTVEQAAAVLGVAPERLEALVAEHAALFRPTPRGLMPTADCREWVVRQLETERAGIDTGALAVCYERFLVANGAFKHLVTGWQTSAGSSGGGAAGGLDGLLEAMERLHAEVRPLVDESAAQLARLACYGRRFDAALDALRAGDASMLASPLKDSYHTVWFEYHEELIALLGRDRAAEERAETQR